MEFLLASFKQLLVFIHLFTFAFAIVEVIKKDINLLKATEIPLACIKKTGTLLARLLLVLWVSGIVLIYMSIGLEVSLLAENPKIMAKITVVLLLTLNGIALHFIAFPLMAKPTQYSALCCSFLGAVSATSWLFASFIGAARIMANQLSYTDFIGIYLISMLFAIIISFIFIKPHVEKLLNKNSANLSPASLSEHQAINT